MCVCVCPGVHFHRGIYENKKKGAKQLKRHREALGRARDHRAGDHESWTFLLTHDATGKRSSLRDGPEYFGRFLIGDLQPASPSSLVSSAS